MKCAATCPYMRMMGELTSVAKPCDCAAEGNPGPEILWNACGTSCCTLSILHYLAFRCKDVDAFVGSVHDVMLNMASERT